MVGFIHGIAMGAGVDLVGRRIIILLMFLNYLYKFVAKQAKRSKGFAIVNFKGISHLCCYS